jgi:predicted Zn-dependent protease with MMP-like domain
MPIRRRGALARRHPHRRSAVHEPSSASFEALVEHALDGLPPDLQRLLENVAIVVEDEPNPAEEDALYGLYEGTPLIEYASDQVAFPNKITLYRLPLEEDFPDPAELADEVRRTVIHELAHHAGFDDRRLRDLGYE